MRQRWIMTDVKRRIGKTGKQNRKMGEGCTIMHEDGDRRIYEQDELPYRQERVEQGKVQGVSSYMHDMQIGETAIRGRQKRWPN